MKETTPRIYVSNSSITRGFSSNCFNPSLVYYQGDLLFFYRYQFKRELCHNIGFVKLDSNFKPTSRHQTLKIPKVTEKIKSCNDPRAFVWKDKLYLSCQQDSFVNNTWSTSVVLGNVDLNNSQLENIHVPNYGKNFNYCITDAPPAFERNWTPLIVNNDFYMIYRINPLTVIKFCPQQQIWTEVEVTHKYSIIPYQTYVSGGTPLIPWRGSEYIGLFHTYVKIDEDRRFYSMGFYTVDVNEWRVTSISPKPILTPWKNKWKDSRRHIVKRMFVETPNYEVVFPLGIIDCGNAWAVSYGWNDCRCYINIYEKNMVIESLIPC